VASAFRRKDSLREIGFALQSPEGIPTINPVASAFRRKDSGRGILSELSAILTFAPPMPGVTTVEIPNRSLFRQPEVCEVAQVQPYVLRSWEAEFPDLGVAKTAGGPRLYRRADVEFVLRIKHLLFVEGLTLAGARRKLVDEQPSAEAGQARLDELFGSDARERLLQVKRGLREIATLLAKDPSAAATAGPPLLFDVRPAKAPKRVVTSRKRKR
jgi:DNA-binding transcriptional MerR regulator